MTLFEISHTSNSFIRENPIFGGGNFFLGGGGRKSGVQSSESRVQSPGSSPAFRFDSRIVICKPRLLLIVIDFVNR